jgi:hypothetical protein
MAASDSDDEHCGKRDRFLKTLKEHSLDKENPIPEWKVLQKQERQDTKCICSTKIMRVFFIQNQHTQEILQVGNVCVEQWMGLAVYCLQCDKFLPKEKRKVSSTDFLCETCYAKQKGERSAYRARTTELGQTKWVSSRKHYGQMFRHIVHGGKVKGVMCKGNTEFVEWVLNRDWSDIIGDRTNVKQFIEYVSRTCGVEEEEVPVESMKQLMKKFY